MIFGRVPLDEAEGAILAHGLRLASGRIAKGTRLTGTEIAALRADAIDAVIAARLAPGDLSENDAAGELAGAMAGPALRLSPPGTGRVNIHATQSGLFRADRGIVDCFNAVDPAITLACLADGAAVSAGDMVATVKIIPLAVSGVAVAAAREAMAGAAPFMLKPFAAHDVTLIATTLPQLKPSVMDKTARVLEQRLVPSASRLSTEIRVPHAADAVAEAIGHALAAGSDRPPLLVVFGASAVCDADDVIPRAIRLAGGTVERVGLPVDPGNLLVLGAVSGVPVIGAPGCARSPKENGFDWVLNRILAGETPSSPELAKLGVGGLLMEIPSRPLPRDAIAAGSGAPGVGIIVLAAGRASRMGEGAGHKLLAEFAGRPLVRLSAEKALGAAADAVVLVTGHRAEEISAAVDGLALTIVANPDFASGMAGSLKAGLSAPTIAPLDGVLVMLADMPAVSTADLDRLIEAFRAAGGNAIVRAAAGGRRGNPVVLPRATFAAVMRLEGDIGARAIVESAGIEVIDVEIGEGALIDVDTPEAILAAGGTLRG